MLVWIIIACEIGFWVMLALGLLARYVFKLNMLSTLLLLCVPLLDIALLVATTLDLSSGKSAELAHGLAAVYLGFTVVYGHSIIQWADRYVSYRFYSGENPKKNLYGWSYAKYEWMQWFKGLLACAIAAVLLLIAIYFIDNPSKSDALTQWFEHLFWLLLIWFLGWPVFYTVFPRKQNQL